MFLKSPMRRLLPFSIKFLTNPKYTQDPFKAGFITAASLTKVTFYTKMKFNIKMFRNSTTIKGNSQSTEKVFKKLGKYEKLD